MMNDVVPLFRIPYGATCELRGLVHGWGGAPVVPGDIATVTWKVYEHSRVQRKLTELEGYAEEALTPADVISSSLLQGEDTQYNFHHVPPNRTTPPFLQIGGVYRIHYILTPQNANDEDIIVPFELEIV